MRVLPAKELGLLKMFGNVPKEQHHLHIDQFQNLLMQGYVRKERDNGCLADIDITPKGKLAIRCHAALAASR